MLDRNGNVKIGDFGLARLIGEELFRNNLTESNRAMGTMDYVAPEQLEPGKPVDCRADIYSVGMMLYKLLTHTLPYGVFVSPSHLVAGLDSRVDEIVIRCLQRNPDNRYQDIRELRADIGKLNSQVKPDSPSKPSNSGKPKPRFPGA
jgi:serine/threonine-protein kinase